MGAGKNQSETKGRHRSILQSTRWKTTRIRRVLKKNRGRSLSADYKVIRAETCFVLIDRYCYYRFNLFRCVTITNWPGFDVFLFHLDLIFFTTLT